MTTKEIAARRQELVAALSVLLPDDDLFALIERADQADDSVAVLQEAYDAAANRTSDVDELMLAHKLSVVEVLTKKQRHNSTEIVDVVVGFELQWHDGERHLYAGKTLSFGPRYKSLPFDSIDAAKRAAIVWIDLQYEKPSYPVTVMRRVRVPVAIGMPTPKNGSQVNWRMNVDETAKMDAILRGLRARNAELEANSPVASYVDAMRWIVRNLFK